MSYHYCGVGHRISIIICFGVEKQKIGNSAIICLYPGYVLTDAEKTTASFLMSVIHVVRLLDGAKKNK